MAGRFLPHIGLRTVKTGLAVALALFFADLRGSPALIFAGIGAIVAMSRTVGDAFETCRTQFFGILLGAGFGAVFVNLFEGFRYVGTGLGLIALILLCVQLKLQFACPSACRPQTRPSSTASTACWTPRSALRPRSWST